ncbi:MAG: coproporphyrinogen-III oxidase family protein [Spirochaetota bacterium]
MKSVEQLLGQLSQYTDCLLYIHVPFCRKKCDYCDFFSCTHLDEHLLTAFTDQVCREIDRASTLRSSNFSTLFIGGGDPGVLGPQRLERILDSATRDRVPAEVSMECNPESLSDNLLAAVQGRVTRLSVGVQSIHEENLKHIGRSASIEQTLRGLDILSTHRDHFELSIDLINSVFQQGYYDTQEDIQTIYDLLEPEHLSIYDLIVEPGTPLERRLSDSTTEYELDENNQIDQETADYTVLLESLGYSRYEVSNWARKGRVCRHNQGYWDMKPYLGIGPSAVSLLYTPEEVYHLYGAKDVEAYAFQKTPFSDRMYQRELLTGVEYLEELLIMGIRTSSGVSLSKINCLFGTDIVPAAKRAMAPWIAAGFVNENIDQVVQVTRDGFAFTNRILLDLAIELEPVVRQCTPALDTYF